jgi:hypothetical protein
MKNMLKWTLALLITTPAWAYNLTQDFANGFYWASLPVKLMVVEKDPERKQLLETLAKDAINEWHERTGLDLWKLTTNGTTNIIRWSNNFAEETKMDPLSVLAVAVRYTDGPYFAKSEIIINGSHTSFNSGLSWMDKANLGTTIVHELGHTMGLDHSENKLAVMARTLQFPYNGLHDDDVEGMTAAHEETANRQRTRYVSPLAYSKESKGGEALSCGTIGAAGTTGAGAGGMLSLISGMLIAFVGNIARKFKSLFGLPKRRHGK